ncbi:histidine phosphatase family protein [Roseomonas sp. WA12]
MRNYLSVFPVASRGRAGPELGRSPAIPRRRAIAGVLAAPMLAWIRPADGAESWALLRAGGVVALIRHARAPGVGDPPGFDLARCETQRNLSEEGRAQARRLGEQFRAERVPVGRVISSGWCRALDTGRLAFGDAVAREPALDSFFEDRAEGPRQSAAMLALAESWQGRADCLICITHQVNVTALTGVVPAEGEIVVAATRKGRFEVLGRMVVR